MQRTTEFEIITAITRSLLLNSRCGDYGSWYGRTLDSTGCLSPHPNDITTIGLDLSALGDSLEAIAEQKAGIIKQGVPLVTGRIVPEALAVIDKLRKQNRLLDCSMGMRLSG